MTGFRYLTTMITLPEGTNEEVCTAKSKITLPETENIDFLIGGVCLSCKNLFHKE